MCDSAKQTRTQVFYCEIARLSPVHLLSVFYILTYQFLLTPTIPRLELSVIIASDWVCAVQWDISRTITITTTATTTTATTTTATTTTATTTTATTTTATTVSSLHTKTHYQYLMQASMCNLHSKFANNAAFISFWPFKIHCWVTLIAVTYF